jgi:hypothetical protein
VRFFDPPPYVVRTSVVEVDCVTRTRGLIECRGCPAR